MKAPERFHPSPTRPTRRNLLRAGFGAAAIGMVPGLLDRLSTAAVAQDASSRKPNIVMILMDDLGWRDVGFMGSRYYETPNIDKLATQGMVFTDAYAPAPNCAPSRACILTGQYTPRHGIYTVGTSERGRPEDRKLIPTPNRTDLPASHTTIAELLKDAGYTSALIGKWHLGEDATGPQAQGYDVNIGGGTGGSTRSYFSPYRNQSLKDGPKGEYLTDRLTDEAIAFITAHRDKPFYVQLSHYAVHTPLQAKPGTVDKFKNKPPVDGQDSPIYAGMVQSMDDSVGRIMQTLDELKLADNTVVIFFSDNGGYGNATSNAPLRGAKGMLYEGGVRSPMIVRWPGVVEPGSRCSEPVIGVDFLPTFVQVAGAKQPASQPVDGASLVPLLKGGKSLDRDAIFFHCPVYLQATGRSLKGPWRMTPAGSIRMGDWKLIEFFEDGKLELYNLADDLSETNDLSAARPEVARKLHDRMVAWRRATGAPVPTEKNPQYNPEKRAARPAGAQPEGED